MFHDGSWLRQWLPTSAVLAWTVYVATQLAGSIVPWGGLQTDHRPPPRSQEIFAAARDVLGDVGDVGFFVDPSARFPSAYFWARYSLAPVRVHLDVEREWILGYFSSPAALRRFQRTHPVEPVALLPEGVVVLRRLPRS